MKYDIKRITHWDAPEENGAPLLCMPNIPKPLHQRCPREIMGQAKWNALRKREYMKQNYTCQASGVEMGYGHVHLHELYDIDYKRKTVTFKRYVCLDPALHTRFIHSGRAYTLFNRADPQMPKSAMLATLEQGFKLISEYNAEHYGEIDLRVSWTILDWMRNPKLTEPVDALIRKYGIKFYDVDESCYEPDSWGKWKLIYEDKEYPTLFPTYKDWEKHFGIGEAAEKKERKIEVPILTELDNLLKEVNGGEES